MQNFPTLETFVTMFYAKWVTWGKFFWSQNFLKIPNILWKFWTSEITGISLILIWKYHPLPQKKYIEGNCSKMDESGKSKMFVESIYVESNIWDHFWTNLRIKFYWTSYYSMGWDPFYSSRGLEELHHLTDRNNNIKVQFSPQNWKYWILRRRGRGFSAYGKGVTFFHHPY